MTDHHRLFDWRGRNRLGQTHSGQLHAVDARSAIQQLHSQGFFDVRLQAAAASPSRRLSRISPKDVSLLTRQLATLTLAGVSVTHALTIASRSTPRARTQQILLQIQQKIEQGLPLHHAFASFPTHFDALYCASVASGEASGHLGEALASLAQHLEKSQALRAKIRSALMYPMVLSGVTVAAVGAIMVYMVPTFEAQFASFGAPLPSSTATVIAVSRTLAQHGIWLLVFGFIVGIGLMRTWQRGQRGRSLLDAWVLQLPLIGRLLGQAAVTRWLRTMATLTQAGLPLLEALQVSRDATGNAVYARANQQLMRAIELGRSLSEAMTETRIFPEVVIHMTQVGEEAGALSSMLEKCAVMLSQEIEENINGLSSILEPLMILILGLAIGGILLAMYMPIFQLGRVI